MQEETRESKSALPRFFTLEMFMFTVTALSGLVLLWSIAVPYRNVAIMVCAGVVFTLSIVVVLSLIHISEPTRQAEISYAVFCLKKKNKKIEKKKKK